MAEPDPEVPVATGSAGLVPVVAGAVPLAVAVAKTPGDTVCTVTVDVIVLVLVDRVVGSAAGVVSAAVVVLGTATAVVAGLVDSPVEPPDGAGPDPPMPFTAAQVPV
jgi:hypothetical protein